MLRRQQQIDVEEKNKTTSADDGDDDVEERMSFLDKNQQQQPSSSSSSVDRLNNKKNSLLTTMVTNNNTCWPANNPKLYASIGGDDDDDSGAGTTVSAVQKSSSRLSTEFTLGAGVSHLFTEEGLRYYYHHTNTNTNTNTTNATTNTSNPKEESNKKKYYTPSAIQFMNYHQLSELKISPRSITMEGLVAPGDENADGNNTTTNPTSPMFLESVLLLTDAPHTLRFFLYDNGAGVEINGLNCAREVRSMPNITLCILRTIMVIFSVFTHSSVLTHFSCSPVF